MVHISEILSFLGISLELIRPCTSKDVALYINNHPELIKILNVMIKTEYEVRKFRYLQARYAKLKRLYHARIDVVHTDSLMDDIAKHVEERKRMIYGKRQNIVNQLYHKLIHKAMTL